MTEKQNDKIVGREETQSIAIDTDPFFTLFNLCHPEHETDNGFGPAAHLSLSEVLMLVSDSRPQFGLSMQKSMARQIVSTLGDDAIRNTELFSTSNVTLATVESIFSEWVAHLYAAIENAPNEPYGKLDELGRLIASNLAAAFKPNRAEVENYISRHKPDDLFNDVVGWLRCEEDEYVGAVEINERTARINIYLDEYELEELLPIAASICAQLASVDRRCRQVASDEYLAIYNETWRTDRSPIMNSENFQSSLVLNSIFIQSINQCDLLYDDGGLFRGHVIRVIVDSTGTPIGTRFEG